MEAYITALFILPGNLRGSHWGGHDHGQVVSSADGELLHYHQAQFMCIYAYTYLYIKDKVDGKGQEQSGRGIGGEGS